MRNHAVEQAPHPSIYYGQYTATRNTSSSVSEKPVQVEFHLRHHKLTAAASDIVHLAQRGLNISDDDVNIQHNSSSGTDPRDDGSSLSPAANFTMSITASDARTTLSSSLDPPLHLVVLLYLVIAADTDIALAPKGPKAANILLDMHVLRTQHHEGTLPVRSDSSCTAQRQRSAASLSSSFTTVVSHSRPDVLLLCHHKHRNERLEEPVPVEA